MANIKEYRLMGYYMGAWWTIRKVYAETDEEAIFDAEGEKERKPYPVALVLGNRFVKHYNQHDHDCKKMERREDRV